MTRELTYPGMRIGLLGGSFNPAHEGHREISLIALRRLHLHKIWWLVSPQNPLKDPASLDEYANRLASAHQIAAHPKIVVSDFERRHELSFTFETIQMIKSIHRGVKFVWLMGADNLLTFNRWENWREIARLTPIAVFARPGSEIQAPLSFAARYLSAYRMEQEDAKLLASRRPPAWIYLTDTLHPASSTAIRRARAQVPALQETDARHSKPL